VSPASEIRFVVQRELQKSFRSAKGVALLLLSLLGGTGATFLLVKAQQLKRERLGEAPAEAIRALREEAATQAFGDPITGKHLADAPEVLIAVLLLTVWLTPMIISLMGFDTISADLQHKSVRYWTLRTRRPSYFIGKFGGLWATVSVMTLTMHAIIWIVCVVRNEAPAGVALTWGLRFWLVTLPISAAWCAISTLVSSFFKSPIVALLATFGAFFSLWLLWIIGNVAHWDFLMYAYPNYYDSYLVHPQLPKAMTGMAACFAMAAVYLGLGSYLFQRKDV
jgi:ABC-type transport system involved in multi-copper enzyme maturation permease subunit